MARVVLFALFTKCPRPSHHFLFPPSSNSCPSTTKLIFSNIILTSSFLFVMNSEQSEEYWRKNGEDWPPSSGLDNSRVPLQPVRFPPHNIHLHTDVPLHRPQSGNYRDVDNQHEETRPHHTAEHRRKPNTSSALDPNSSTTGSHEQNITHSYGPVCAGYECVKGSITHRQRDGTYGNAGARESVGMYGNECESFM